MCNIEVAEWDQEHDHVHDLGKGTDVDPEVENIFGATEKEIEVDHGGMNPHLILEDMIAGVYTYS